MSRNLFDDFLWGKEVGDSDSDLNPDQLDRLSSSSDSYVSDDQAHAGADDVQWRARHGTQWSKYPPPPAVTPSGRDIIKGPLSHVIHAKHVNNLAAMFALFITQDMIASIVKFSNIEGKKLREKQWFDMSTEGMWATISQRT